MKRVGEHQDAEEFGAGSGPRASRRSRSRRSSSSGLTAAGYAVKPSRRRDLWLGAFFIYVSEK
jgi:hypothetical protein